MQQSKTKPVWLFDGQAGFSWLAVHQLLAFQGTPVALDSLVFSTATPVNCSLPRNGSLGHLPERLGDKTC